jgi:ArsR family transcriptional regulator
MSICSDSQKSFRDEASCAARIIDADAVDRVSAVLSTPESTNRTTAIFSALSDPTRFRILEALSVEELCVCDLAEIAEVSESGASHQLRLLRDRGLVSYRREGNRAVYRLADDHVRDLLEIGRQHAAEGGRP